MYKLKTYEAPMGRIASWVDFEDTSVGTTLFDTEAEAIALMKSTIAQCRCPIKLKVVKCRNRR